MPSSRQWSVRTRLAAAFGALAVIVLAISALAAVALGRQQAEFARFVTGVNARAVLSTQVRTAVDRRAVAVRDMVMVGTPDELRAEGEAAKKAHADVVVRLARLRQLIQQPDVAPEARKLFDAIADIEAKYSPVALSIVDLAAAGKVQEAVRKINVECRPLLHALAEKSDAYNEYTLQQADAMVREAQEHYASSRDLLVAACVAAVAVALLAGWRITRSLTRALGAEPDDLNAVAGAIANGDLSALRSLEGAPAASVMASLAAMRQSLARIVDQVRQSSDSIATGSSEIAIGNADLSSRTEEQSSALQQTSATMDQLSATVRANADNARSASELALGVSATAARGGDMMDRVVGTMKEIDDSSKHIADIIATIDGIAFQTNILALNAAVEAARAGEQGRGFAVVAGEVRSLAQRSAGASKEIRGLIQASVSRVASGNQIVAEAGTVIRQVVQDIKRVTDIVGEISSSSAEQSTGLTQATQAVAQMEQVTQQNAALVEEGAAASENLKHQARRLNEVVRIFRLEQRPLLAA